MNLVSLSNIKLTTALLALALCAADAAAMSPAASSTAGSTAAASMTASRLSSASSSATSTAETEQESAYDASSSSSAVAAASMAASSSSSTVAGETKAIAPTEQSTHRSRLNTLLYDELDPMPPELIGIILDYECYEFKGKCIKTIKGNEKMHVLTQLTNGLYKDHIATGSDEGRISIWDLNATDDETKACVHTLIDYTENVECLTQLADGRLASSTWDYIIKIWNLGPGIYLKTLTGHTGPVSCLIQVTTGRYKGHIVSGSSDGTIKIWDLTIADKTKACVKTLTDHRLGVTCLTLLADDQLASCSWERDIKIWDLETGKCVKTLNGHKNDVKRLIQLADGRIASGSLDGTIKIWDLKTGKCVKTLNDHKGWVLGLIQLTDGRLASCSWDMTIKIWDLESGECVKTLNDHNKWVLGLIQLADGRLVSCSNDGTIKILE